MNGDSLPAGDVAHNLFAANGVTTSRTIDEQVVLTFHFKSIRARVQVNAPDCFRHTAELGVDARVAIDFGGAGREGAG
jgi:hypothetical protein